MRRRRVRVLAYEDRARGTMREDADGGGRITEVTLRPRVVLAHGSETDLALRLHDDAHRKCFIASSVNFPVKQLPQIEIEG